MPVATQEKKLRKAVMHTILARMPDYVHCITSFGLTHIHLQWESIVDISGGTGQSEFSVQQKVKIYSCAASRILRSQNQPSAVLRPLPLCRFI
jgi:hypothetical protein